MQYTKISWDEVKQHLELEYGLKTGSLRLTHDERDGEHDIYESIDWVIGEKNKNTL